MTRATRSLVGLGLGELVGGSWGNPRGRPAPPAIKILYKNPLDTHKGYLVREQNTGSTKTQKPSKLGPQTIPTAHSGWISGGNHVGINFDDPYEAQCLFFVCYFMNVIDLALLDMSFFLLFPN